MEAMRGRRIELRNLFRNPTVFGQGLAYPLKPIQKAMAAFATLMAILIAIVFFGVLVVLAMRLLDRFGNRWGLVAVAALFVTCFFTAIGLLNLVSSRVRHALKETPLKR
jgi:hypothetical protein